MTNHNRTSRLNVDEAAAEAAARWHDLIVGGDVSPQVRASFEAWLDESPAHRAAYGAVEHAWTLTASMAFEPQILALRHETALRLTRHSSSYVRSRVRWAAVLAGVAACGLFGAVLFSSLQTNKGVPLLDGRPTGVTPADLQGTTAGGFVTQKGERMTARLEDGSQLTLNTETRVEPRFSNAERLVIMDSGQALFEVAQDSNRPFIVETRGRRLVAVGTSFDVRVDGERMQVTMVEGIVRVEHKQPARFNAYATPETSALLLHAGEQLTTEVREQDRVRAANAERVISWRLGQVIFEDTRLSDAVAELNRYSYSRIELKDPKLSGLRISGAFATGHPTVFVEALTTYFPIQAHRTDDETIVLTSRD